MMTANETRKVSTRSFTATKGVDAYGRVWVLAAEMSDFQWTMAPGRLEVTSHWTGVTLAFDLTKTVRCEAQGEIQLWLYTRHGSNVSIHLYND